MEETDQTQPPIKQVPNANSRPPPRGTASYQRRRAVTACQVCRARRTKCDNRKPSCSFCLKTGATCIQSPVDLSSFDPASLKILERLDQLEELISKASLDADEGRTRKKRAIGDSESTAPQEVATDAPPLHESTFLPCELDDILAAWPCFRDVTSQSSARSDASPGQVSLTGSYTQSSISGIVALDLEPQQINQLLDNFFAYVHVKNPIFDERPTRRLIQSTIIDGIAWSSESCLSLLVCALGSLATPFGPNHEPVVPGSEAYANAMAFFQAAQKRLGMLLCSDDTLAAAQCLFLSGVFLMCTFQETKAWRHFLQSLAHCQQLSFLSPRSQRRYYAMLDSDGDLDDFDSLHQAIYWSAWKSEREMRGHLTLPDFSPHDHAVGLYPNFFPTPPSPQLEDKSQASEDQAWYFYLAEISLRRLAARIADDIEAIRKKHTSRKAGLEAAAEVVPYFVAQMTEWIDSLPPFLSFTEPSSEDDVCRFVLRGHAINLYELIHWPFLSAHLDAEPLDPAALQAFTYLSQAAIDHHAMRLKVNEPGYRHRHHGTAPMLRSCSRSAAILVAVWRYLHRQSLSGFHGYQIGLRMPPGWRDLLHTFLVALDYWGPEFPKLEQTRWVLSRCLSDGP